MSDLSELVRSERLALIDLLDGLTAREWATPSLCRAWTVQDVAAHLAWTPVLPLLEGGLGMLRSRLRLNAFIADSAVRWARRGPAAILDQLRATAAQGAGPTGMPPAAVLTDAAVHALDIRRPLQAHRPVPPEAFVAVADFNARLRWPLTIPTGGGNRSRLEGVRLVASDVDWFHGHGLEVRAPAETVLLVLTGRAVGREELAGPGANRLHERL